MRKDVNSASLVMLAIVVLLVLKIMDNPRLAALHGTDIFRLFLIGLGTGMAIGIQVGKRVFGAKPPQP